MSGRAYATVTWDQLHRDARTLASMLMPMEPFRGIVAVTRGGLIPAAIVARELECRLVETISIVSYDEEVQGAPRVIKSAPAAGDGEGFLIVDDLVDSGVTARLVRNLLPRAHFACLYAKPAGNLSQTTTSSRCRKIRGSCSLGTPPHFSCRRWPSDKGLRPVGA